MKIKDRVMVFFAVALLKALHCTAKWEIKGCSCTQLEEWFLEPTILAFWHSQQLSFVMVPSSIHKAESRPEKLKLGPFSMLSSRHRDGRLIAEAISYFNVKSIAGSSNKGGAAAMRAMVNALQEGNNVGITPDGPRGPARVAKNGAAKLAQMSGAKIVPCALKASSCYRFSSWDRMFLIKPFSRLELTVGPPLTCPPELPVEEATALVQAALDAVNVSTTA